MRSTVAAASVVGIALVMGLLAGWWLLRRSLTTAAIDAVSGRSQEVASLIASQGIRALDPDRQPVFGEVIQVMTPGSLVLSAAPPSARRLQLRFTAPTAGHATVTEVPALPQSGADEPYILVARTVRDGQSGQQVVVVVGRSVAGLAETAGAVGQLTVVGLPLLVFVTGAATYLFTGRALRPVEAIRLRVREISSRGLAERVPVPDVRDEIGLLAETMNEMLARLQSAHEAQRRFVADAGHELRSPLSTILVALDVARQEASAGSSMDGRVLDDVGAESARMSRLVDDLLLLARADESGLRMRADDVDLDDLLESEARRLAADGTRHVSYDTEPVRVLGDRDRLVQVVRNLTDNAARHARSQIHLSVRSRLGSAELRVEDDGLGIPAPDRARVFDRFVRLDASRQRGSGESGLGLSIVREIVSGHGGQVGVEVSRWGGVAAVVRLPLPTAAPGAVAAHGHPASGSSR
ncbi:MAG: HAMP domain-containing sensor histidine kinase [Kineosporiaceae bacterium]